MSQILSGLILQELSKTSVRPEFRAQQAEFANAIATAVQQYISTLVVQVGPTGTGTIIAP